MAWGHRARPRHADQQREPLAVGHPLLDLTRSALTATLTPTAATGTVVNGTVSVIDSTDFTAFEPDIGFPLFSDFHDFAYAYTVGS